ncbi:hypothetical protein BEN71_10555 [Acinetobacter wuhouensis]|uniref:CbrC family protein n=1 Tax=Acinetobacter wuhouensis TaxID=1879050 RepID=UPI00083B8B6C|nr:CbrC family protein [Acinetobacter wuhouensis]AXQ22487.1 hypothetical protein BEN71_10555 [Acinetobacter wuhouensis]
MDYPNFKYHPNAYKLDIFIKEDGICSVCKQQRNLKYNCSFYSIDKPDYICPWCIENGEVAKKFEGSFFDLADLESAIFHQQADGDFYFTHEMNPELIDTILYKTPSYFTWQQAVWLTHCMSPCKFIAYATSENIKDIYNELIPDIQESCVNEDSIQNNMYEDGWFKGYLFQCVHCSQHRLHIDCS